MCFHLRSKAVSFQTCLSYEYYISSAKTSVFLSGEQFSHKLTHKPKVIIVCGPNTIHLIDDRCHKTTYHVVHQEQQFYVSGFSLTICVAKK